MYLTCIFTPRLRAFVAKENADITMMRLVSEKSTIPQEVYGMTVIQK